MPASPTRLTTPPAPSSADRVELDAAADERAAVRGGGVEADETVDAIERAAWPHRRDGEAAMEERRRGLRRDDLVHAGVGHRGLKRDPLPSAAVGVDVGFERAPAHQHLRHV
jgi:hypothetical protein